MWADIWNDGWGWSRILCGLFKTPSVVDSSFWRVADCIYRYDLGTGVDILPSPIRFGFLCVIECDFQAVRKQYGLVCVRFV